MKQSIQVPKGTLALVKQIFKRTDNYLLTKLILKRDYGINIKLVTQ